MSAAVWLMNNDICVCSKYQQDSPCGMPRGVYLYKVIQSGAQPPSAICLIAIMRSLRIQTPALSNSNECIELESSVDSETARIRDYIRNMEQEYHRLDKLNM